MRIAFRTDAAPHTGIGHLMRCLTLADTLREQGAEVRFASRHLSPHLRELVVARGHDVALLDPATTDTNVDELSHSDWLGTSQGVDAKATIEALGSAEHDWVVVDHYALDVRWETAMRAIARRVMVIDDMADRVHDCDLLMDQNLFPDSDTRYDGFVPDRCARLLGPTYALLRKEFATLRARTGVRRGPIRRILVLLGGSDEHDQTEKTIRAIAGLGCDSLRADVVIGGGHRARDAIAGLCAEFGYECHVQAGHVAELMLRADLAFGATGSTSWERCCLGVPTICVTFEANQVPIADGLAATGAIVNLGDASALSEKDLAAELHRFIDDPARLAAMSEAALALVDGGGASRVCERIMELS